jgi:hypothetical protein
MNNLVEAVSSDVPPTAPEIEDQAAEEATAEEQMNLYIDFLKRKRDALFGL